MLAIVVALGGDDHVHRRPQAGRPECPHDWDFKMGTTPYFETTIDVPEFNDCQRLMVTDPAPSGGLKYGSLYAVFASSQLGQIDSMLNRPDTVKMRDSARVRGTTGSGSGSTTPTTPAFGLLAAFVYAEGSYLQLGIRQGFSCLYLAHGATPGTWGAAMVSDPSARGPGSCRPWINMIAPPAGATALKAVPDSRAVGMSDADYPAVARWDWDSAGRRHYIGIKCGAAWCEVGGRGSIPAWPTTAAMSSTGPRGLAWRTTVIKGWFDQQYLAKLDASGHPVPSLIRGTIYPDSLLDSRQLVTDYVVGTWYETAHIALDVPAGEDASPYRKALNLDPTPTGSRLNDLFLCRGTRRDCWGADPGAEVTNVLDRCAAQDWWIKIRSARGAEVPRCAVRRPHDSSGGPPVRGTVRWRWLATDETVWDACAQGCCETEVFCPGGC